MRQHISFIFVLLFAACSLASAQEKYRVSYEELKKYQGTYQYTGNTTLQIAASPVDTMLYAIIGTSRYKLRPSAKDIFLNNGNQKVEFVRNGNQIQGYHQEGDDAGKIFKLLDTKVGYSEKMWYARENKGKPFVYRYQIPLNLKDGLVTGSAVGSGLDTGLLRTLMNRIVDGTYPNVHSVLLIKNGKLVLEEYFYDNDVNRLHELRSASKSFTSALVGIASDKKMLSLSAPMLSYLKPNVMLNPDPRKQKITIENLLSQKSGFACYDYDSKSPGNESKMYPTGNWIKFMLDLPMAADPGTAASYCSGNVMLLNQIISNVSGQSVHDFASQYLFNKLGVKNFKWDFVPDSSRENDFGQVHLASRDMAKFGLLYLNDGKWKGKQVISADYVSQSLSPSAVVDGIPYGYLWWCEDLTANGKVFKGRAAKGNGGQRIFLFPDQDLVAVITAGNYNAQSPANKLLIECVLHGLVNSKPD